MVSMVKMDSVDSYDRDGGSCEEEESRVVSHPGSKKSNILPLWGNERTMNLNALILTNIQSSHYFKVNLYELKTYHEVIDEIYYKVNHLEPWEKGSRKTAGQTGMCGGSTFGSRRYLLFQCTHIEHKMSTQECVEKGSTIHFRKHCAKKKVRGVGAGGIVSTAYCLLYKLFTLKLTRKQVNGLITHPDSPYIRALGFMYIRYTQPPQDLWDWYDEYLEDPEELDVKAGGGQVMTIGNILKNFLCKLEWFSTLFPRIPVPIQQKLEKMMNERFPPPAVGMARKPVPTSTLRHIPDSEAHYGEAEKMSRMRGIGRTPERNFSRERDVDRREYSSGRDKDDRRGYSRDRENDKRQYSREAEVDRRDYSRDRERGDYSRERERVRDYSREHDRRVSGERRERDRDRDRRDQRRKDRDSPARRREDEDRYYKDRHRHHRH